jgi:anaerobic selenocysteine-containing dehydrogenase
MVEVLEATGMFEQNENGMSRRGFLKGSALFAAAVGLAMALPAQAQEPQKQAPDSGDKKDKPAEKKLLDKDGREYRICDMCGGNMYKHEKTWTCEVCGYSYDE